MRIDLFLVILGGALHSLSYPNPFFAPIPIPSIIGLSFLFYTWFKHHLSWKNLFILTLLFSQSFNLFSYYWITQTLMDFGQLPWVVAFFLNFLHGFICTPQFFLFLFVFKKFSIARENSLIFSLLFVLIEYFTPQQFKVMLGQPWIDFPDLLKLGPVFGLPFYSFLSLQVSLLLLFNKMKKGFNQQGLINISICILLLIFSNMMSNENDQKSNDRSLNVRLVQANISSHLKVSSETGETASVEQVIQEYKDLSKEPFLLGENKKLDLIIWPETAYPYSLNLKEKNEKKENYNPAPKVIQEISMHHKSADIFFGGYEEIHNRNYFESEYNTMFHYKPDQSFGESYHKHILIPFGETLPLGPLKEKASQYISHIAFFKSGETYPINKIKNDSIKTIATICYEILSPEFLRTYLNKVNTQPEILINLTNDSWYGKTSEPWQHFYLSRWRAIEFSIPMIRSTNTGISAIVNHKGIVESYLGVFQKGNLDYELKIRKRDKTLYQKLGIFSFLLLALFIWLLSSFFQKTTSRHFQSSKENHRGE